MGRRLVSEHPGAEPVPGVRPGSRVLVAGLAVSGVAAATALLDRGVDVVVVDGAPETAVGAQAQRVLRAGGRVLLGADATAALPDGVDLVVSSPGWAPSAPILVDAARRGIPVWGEAELAWRLRGPGAAAWLVVTGTNGKTTTTRMLESMLRADGRHAVAAGNIGLPLVSVVTGPERYETLAVELSSFQLYTAHTTRPQAAAVLNVAADHADWHGSLEAYAQAKGRAYDRCQVAAVHNIDDPTTGELARLAALGPACRRVGFTLSAPHPGSVGVADGVLVDWAFAGPDGRAVELCPVTQVQPAAPHNTANALAAAALARASGVAPDSVAAGLRAFCPEPHRMATVGTVDGVRYVDDSKATNPHAAAASLSACPSVVWVAGGLAKGAAFDDVVRAHRDRLRGVVLLGRDRDRIATALARHAPTIPVVEVLTFETDDVSLMDAVVRAAHRMARPGDAVLLAPACASWDQFRDYGDRGTQFAQAVQRLTVTQPQEAP